MSGLYKVLIVDDEMLIRQGIINYIDWEQEGFEIAGEASNGIEALEVMEEIEPDIVITDVVMPGMDGIELVKVLKEKYPSVEIIVLSSFENFDYVRSTFQNGVADYILKPKLNGTELIKTLRRILPQPLPFNEMKQSSSSLEELLKKRMLGSSLTSGEEDELLEGLPYSHFRFAAATVLDDHEAADLEKWNLELRERVNHIEGLFIPVNVSDTTIVLLNFNSDKLSDLQQSLTRLAEDYRRSGANISSLMSGSFTSIQDLKTVYEDQLLKLKDYLFYLDDPVLFYDSLPVLEKQQKSFNLSRFIDSFKQKKFDAAIYSLEEHVNRLIHDYTIDIFEFKSWLENIIFNIIVLLGNMKYDVDELESLKYQYFEEINEAKHAKGAISCFHEFLERVKRIVQVETKKSCPPNMHRLLQYIDEHYAEPLSLTVLAENFHFNSSYLSSYFSTHHNVGFSDYLNQVRIEKAKQILQSTSVAVSQVSDMVGYSEPSYFCKVFKRMEGSSPGRYRKKTPAMN
ncbi:response regulator transcription factor [Halobacillus salinarum]|uniref:Response regulator transcription factor n=1 Tax=Halobacillus salinarum TaxID=2932257 RepID=A0ABY4EIB6_9BACI|nr:response regulator transcription factor [Halobacillus salinarum]UOQ44215.1 response regulator transcription factor [Halobacillus salinarum]